MKPVSKEILIAVFNLIFGAVAAYSFLNLEMPRWAIVVIYLIGFTLFRLVLEYWHHHRLANREIRFCAMCGEPITSELHSCWRTGGVVKVYETVYDDHDLDIS